MESGAISPGVGNSNQLLDTANARPAGMIGQWPCVKLCRNPAACRNCYVMSLDWFGWVPDARPLGLPGTVLHFLHACVWAAASPGVVTLCDNGLKAERPRSADMGGLALERLVSAAPNRT